MWEVKEFMTYQKEPSAVWATWLNDLRFLKNVDVEALRLHVGFGYYLGSPIERDIWTASRWKYFQDDPDSKQRVVEHNLLTLGLHESFIVSEGDPERERFSICPNTQNTVWINTDVLRTQVDISNLARFGLLEFQPRNYVEVGGGYGQLARAVLSASPTSTYTIIDFPEVLDVVRRWLTYSSPHIPIISSDIDQAHEVPVGCLRLIPNTLLNTTVDCDVLININSFCEMTEDQVISYIDLSRINWKFLYSNNRNRQFMNFDLTTPLVDLLRRFGIVWPSKEDYEMLSTDVGIRIDDPKMITITTRFGIEWIPPIEPHDIAGLSGRSMPAL